MHIEEIILLAKQQGYEEIAAEDASRKRFFHPQTQVSIEIIAKGQGCLVSDIETGGSERYTYEMDYQVKISPPQDLVELVKICVNYQEMQTLLKELDPILTMYGDEKNLNIIGYKLDSLISDEAANEIKDCIKRYSESSKMASIRNGVNGLQAFIEAYETTRSTMQDSYGTRRVVRNARSIDFELVINQFPAEWYSIVAPFLEKEFGSFKVPPERMPLAVIRYETENSFLSEEPNEIYTQLSGIPSRFPGEEIGGFSFAKRNDMGTSIIHVSRMSNPNVASVFVYDPGINIDELTIRIGQIESVKNLRVIYGK